MLFRRSLNATILQETGDFLLRVISKDISTYQKLMLEKINEIEEVASTQTMVILSTFKESKVLPIP